MSCDFMGHSVCIGGGLNLRKKVKADKKKKKINAFLLRNLKIKKVKIISKIKKNKQ